MTTYPPAPAWGWLNFCRRQQPEPPSENVLTTLDRRFAEGALSPEEYKQRRDVLTGAAAPHSTGKLTPS